MDEFRTEHDLIGERHVPRHGLTGVHTLRADENFQLAQRPVHQGLVRAFGAVKLAAAQTNAELAAGRLDRQDQADQADIWKAIQQACEEMLDGHLAEHVNVDALQGGAGTSTNMAVNEVLANRALQLLGDCPGNYQRVSPSDHLNLHQSTNDTYPTALRITAIWGLRELEQSVIRLLEAFQQKEQEFADVVKIGRTQMQDAVLTTLGREMAAYADALARDRWRIYKCEERLRVVNLGGTAIGTGLGAPRQFIFRACERLKQITGIGLARAENLVEATQNADVFVEVSGILRALSTTLIKIANDLRLMSSGPDGGIGEIRLPAVQAGSSIMPGKINPVIPEAVVQAGMVVSGYDLMISQAAAAGSLELNPFMPLIADALLSEIGLLQRTCAMFARRCVAGIEADHAQCRSHVENSTATLTALVDKIGYEAATRIAAEIADQRREPTSGDDSESIRQRSESIRQRVVQQGLLTDAEFDEAISADAVMRLGSRSE